MFIYRERNAPVIRTIKGKEKNNFLQKKKALKTILRFI